LRKKIKITYWNVPVDEPLNDALEEAVRIDWHRTKAEFIRDAVRRTLQEMGFKPPKLVEEVNSQEKTL